MDGKGFFLWQEWKCFFFYGFLSVIFWLKLEETEEDKADNNY